MLLFNVTPLTQLIQSSILFDDLGASTNRGGGVVDDGASNSSLASPSSRAVIVRDGYPGVSIHSVDDESAVSKYVPPEPKNLSLDLKDDGVSVPLQDGSDVLLQNTVVDVSTLCMPPNLLCDILFLTLSLYYLLD